MTEARSRWMASERRIGHWWPHPGARRAGADCENPMRFHASVRFPAEGTLRPHAFHGGQRRDRTVLGLPRYELVDST